MVKEGSSYHHGDLRRALIDAALELIEERGLAQLSMREVARRVGVSHAAPRHHFADRQALLAAIAVEGYTLLSAATEQAVTEHGSDRVETAVAYIDFALEHPAHFEVMFRPDQYWATYDEAFDTALGSSDQLAEMADPLRDGRPDGAGAGDPQLLTWSTVHGFVALLRDGNFPPDVRRDPQGTFRRMVARMVVLEDPADVDGAQVDPAFARPDAERA